MILKISIINIIHLTYSNKGMIIECRATGLLVAVPLTIDPEYLLTSLLIASKYLASERSQFRGVLSVS